MRSIFGATLIVRHVLTATHLVCTAVRKPLQFSVGNSDWFRKQKTIRLSSLIVNIQLPKYISALHMHAIGVYIYIYYSPRVMAFSFGVMHAIRTRSLIK